MKWIDLKKEKPPENTEIVHCYKDPDSKYWETQVIHEKNLYKCDYGSSYWAFLPQQKEWDVLDDMMPALMPTVPETNYVTLEKTFKSMDKKVNFRKHLKSKDLFGKLLFTSPEKQIDILVQTINSLNERIKKLEEKC